jgi:hypothetical protein
LKLRNANQDAILNKKENDEIKKLNHKLIEKVDYLQSVVDKEASGKEYYFNFPSNPIEPTTAIKKAEKAEKEVDRTRQVYEKKMQLDNRIHENAL